MAKGKKEKKKKKKKKREKRKKARRQGQMARQRGGKTEHEMKARSHL